MHPNPAFRADPGSLLDRAAAIGFAHLFVATPVGPMVAHVPVTRHGDGLRCHLARANRLHPHLAGATVLVSTASPEGDVSPTWYAKAGNQVPTWNYVAVEVEGVATPIGEPELLEHLDALAAAHEPAPTPWTRAKTDPVAIAALLRAIQGFVIEPTALRGTSKLSQNKSDADRAGVRAGLRGRGGDALAAAMEP